MENEINLFERMLDETGEITIKYSPIYGICATVQEIEPKTTPACYRVTVTCAGKVVLSEDVTSYEEFNAALTKGVGIGLGIDDMGVNL